MKPFDWKDSVKIMMIITISCENNDDNYKEIQLWYNYFQKIIRKFYQNRPFINGHKFAHRDTKITEADSW